MFNPKLFPCDREIHVFLLSVAAANSGEFTTAEAAVEFCCFCTFQPHPSDLPPTFLRYTRARIITLNLAELSILLLLLLCTCHTTREVLGAKLKAAAFCSVVFIPDMTALTFLDSSFKHFFVNL